MKKGQNCEVAMIRAAIDPRRGAHEFVIVKAGRHTVKRIVPPAGEANAFDVTRWEHTIEVSVSPTGRSVRVFVNDEEFKLLNCEQCAVWRERALRAEADADRLAITLRGDALWSDKTALTAHDAAVEQRTTDIKGDT